MLPSPLPDWLRERVAEVVAAYRAAALFAEGRCKQIATGGRRGEDGRLCDDFGTIDDYRFDAKYCAGMAVRIPQLLDDRLTAEERINILRELAHLDNGENQHSKEIPRDPRDLARWAWDNPWKNVAPLPPPTEAIREYRTKDYMWVLTQREAEAFILCKALKMTAEEAAPVMGTTPEAVERSVRRAQSRLKSLDEINK